MPDLDAALRLNPNFADAYQNRGLVKNVLKLFPEALADFNQALKLNPGKNNGAIYVGRGISKLYQRRVAASKRGTRASFKNQWFKNLSEVFP